MARPFHAMVLYSATPGSHLHGYDPMNRFTRYVSFPKKIYNCYFTARVMYVNKFSKYQLSVDIVKAQLNFLRVKINCKTTFSKL
jgi:hypothetical protein